MFAFVTHTPSRTTLFSLSVLCDPDWSDHSQLDPGQTSDQSGTDLLFSSRNRSRTRRQLRVVAMVPCEFWYCVRVTLEQNIPVCEKREEESLVRDVGHPGGSLLVEPISFSAPDCIPAAGLVDTSIPVCFNKFSFTG